MSLTRKITVGIMTACAVAVLAFALVGCGQKNVPDVPKDNPQTVQEALDSEYLAALFDLAQDNYENLGLDPEENYAYWMSLKQQLDPEGNGFISALAMENLDYAENTKVTFDGICNVISEYPNVDKDRLNRLQENVEMIYEYISPFCTETMFQDEELAVPEDVPEEELDTDNESVEAE